MLHRAPIATNAKSATHAVAIDAIAPSRGGQRQINHTVWVDVTTMLRWHRPVVGIVRVQQQLARWILEHSKDGIRFCRYDRTRRRHVEVAEGKVAKRISFFDKTTATLAVARERKRKKKTPGRKFVSALRALAERLDGLSAIRRRAALARSAPSSHTTGNCIFGIGDVFVSTGADWDDQDLVQLAKCKSAFRLKTIGMCFDTIPVKFPHLTPAGIAKMFGSYLSDFARTYDHVMCISRCTERDFHAFVVAAGHPVPDTSVVTLGSDLTRTDTPVSGESPPEISKAVAEATTAPFVMYVSTIERRKNHETLYKAWVRLIESGCNVPNLLFVGMRGWRVNDLLADLSGDPRIKGRIHLLHRVSDSELAYLYQASWFTLYPSLYEGWGLPVVESLAFGKFCLCSNASSLAEAGQAFAEYLDPWDVVAWSDHIRYLTEHPEEIEARNRQIAASFKGYSWSETARSILDKAEKLATAENLHDGRPTA